MRQHRCAFRADQINMGTKRTQSPLQSHSPRVAVEFALARLRSHCTRILRLSPMEIPLTPKLRQTPQIHVANRWDQR